MSDLQTRPTRRSTIGPLARIVAEQLPRLRAQRGMTAAQLGDRLAAVGSRITGDIVSKIESGNRGVSLDDAAQLAAALDVALVNLITPWSEQPMRVTPTVEVTPAAARHWIRGEEPLPISDRAWYRRLAPHTDRAALDEKVARARDEVDALRRRLRVAKAKTRIFFEELAKLDSAAERGVTSIGRNEQMILKRLDAAYEEVAELTVRLEDANLRLANAQAEALEPKVRGLPPRVGGRGTRNPTITSML